MASRNSRSRDRKSSFALYALALIPVLAVAVWWFWPTKVPLDPRGYDIAIALCRACNQRDTVAMDRVAELLKELPDRDGQRQALAEVVRQAEQGDWKDAERDCRQLLTDQLTH